MFFFPSTVSITGEYITKAPTGLGLVVGLPFSMPIGPLDISFSAAAPDLPVNIMVDVNGNFLTAIDDEIEGNTGYVSGFVMVGTSF